MTAAAFLAFAGSSGRARGPRGRPRRAIRRDERRAGAPLGRDVDLARPRRGARGDASAPIAREKAGIFRRGRPAARARERRTEALATSSGRRATAAGASSHDASAEIAVTGRSTGVEGTRFDWRPRSAATRSATPLAGAHQAGNAALAVRAAELLEPDRPALTAEASPRGWPRVRWPGRLERFRRRGPARFCSTGATTPEGASALRRVPRGRGSTGCRASIFGAMADKDVEAIAAALFPARPASPARARAVAPRRDAGGARSGAPPGSRPMSRRAATLAARSRALLAAPSADPIIVAGSLYLVGEARALLLARDPLERTRGTCS